jgi:glycosyltransferase involved in cell wall biosynthesis
VDYRIALFSSEYPPHVYGGLGTHVGEITAAMAGRAKFDLFVPAKGDYANDRSAVRLHEVPITPAANNVELWLHYCHAAVKLAERAALSVDLIHCHDWMTVLAGIKLRSILGKPLVYNVHLPQALDSYQGLEKLGLVAADLVLVNSLAVKQEISAHQLPLRRVEVVPNGVDLETFHPAGDWPADGGYILFVGRLVPQKGVTFLLQALSVVLQRCPNTRLIVAGDGELDLFLKRIARYLGIPHRVTFLDWTTGQDLVALYQQAKFVVVPSCYEPFGIVALEAMACARPVIASRTGGLVEIVDDGVNGFLVDVGDHLQLAQRMVSLIKDDQRREAMGQAARKRASEFSWNTVGEQTLKLYDSLVGQEIEPITSTLDNETFGRLLDKLEPDARRIVLSVVNSLVRRTDSARAQSGDYL